MVKNQGHGFQKNILDRYKYDVSTPTSILLGGYLIVENKKTYVSKTSGVIKYIEKGASVTTRTEISKTLIDDNLPKFNFKDDDLIDADFGFYTGSRVAIVLDKEGVLGLLAVEGIHNRNASSDYLQIGDSFWYYGLGTIKELHNCPVGKEIYNPFKEKCEADGFVTNVKIKAKTKDTIELFIDKSEIEATFLYGSNTREYMKQIETLGEDSPGRTERLHEPKIILGEITEYHKYLRVLNIYKKNKIPKIEFSTFSLDIPENKWTFLAVDLEYKDGKQTIFLKYSGKTFTNEKEAINSFALTKTEIIHQTRLGYITMKGGITSLLDKEKCGVYYTSSDGNHIENPRSISDKSRLEELIRALNTDDVLSEKLANPLKKHISTPINKRIETDNQWLPALKGFNAGTVPSEDLEMNWTEKINKKISQIDIASNVKRVRFEYDKTKVSRIKIRLASTEKPEKIEAFFGKEVGYEYRQADLSPWSVNARNDYEIDGKNEKLHFVKVTFADGGNKLIQYIQPFVYKGEPTYESVQVYNDGRIKSVNGFETLKFNQRLVNEYDIKAIADKVNANDVRFLDLENRDTAIVKVLDFDKGKVAYKRELEKLQIEVTENLEAINTVLNGDDLSLDTIKELADMIKIQSVNFATKHQLITEINDRKAQYEKIAQSLSYINSKVDTGFQTIKGDINYLKYLIDNKKSTRNQIVNTGGSPIFSKSIEKSKIPVNFISNASGDVKIIISGLSEIKEASTSVIVPELIIKPRETISVWYEGGTCYYEILEKERVVTNDQFSKLFAFSGSLSIENLMKDSPLFISNTFIADDGDLTLTSKSNNIKLHLPGNTVIYNSYRLNKGDKVFVSKNINHYDLFPISEYKPKTPPILPLGYEIQVKDGVFNGDTTETINITIPAGKKLAKEPELTLLNPHSTVYMIGANYHINDTAGGLYWRWQQYMPTSTQLKLESKGHQVKNSAYRMTLTFINI